MSELAICPNCHGAGVIKIPGGIRTCERCIGNLYVCVTTTLESIARKIDAVPRRKKRGKGQWANQLIPTDLLDELREALK